MLALAGLLAATVTVSGAAVAGLGAVDARTQELYHHNILTIQATADRGQDAPASNTGLRAK